MSTFEYDDIAALVRAEAPSPRMAFRADLDRKVAAGFARSSRIPRPSLRTMLPAMAAVTTLAVGAVVVTSELKDSPVDTPAMLSSKPAAGTATGTADGDAELQAQAFAEPPAAAAKSAAGEAATTVSRDMAAPAPLAAASRSRAFGRKVEHTTTLELSTSAGKLQDTADDVVKTTQAVGGIVQSSQVDTTDGGGTATFTLSIPTAHLDDAIKRLSGLAHVASMSQGTQDITGSFVSVTDRLSDARAERKALLKALGVATTPERIATLKARLRNNRSEIASYKGSLASLRKRTNNTKVDVTITGAGKEKSDGGGWTIGGAGDDALKVLQVMASIVLISAAILVPLGLIGLLTAGAIRTLGRRRREQALDSA